jgi:hypothetical protein
MTYIAQKTRVASLSIGSEDYTDAFVSFTVSDSASNRQGFITTTGTLVIGQRPGQNDLTHYRRSRFRRGTEVRLSLIYPGVWGLGAVSLRHPRGQLYVISTGWNAEEEQMEIELGCRLALALITEDTSALLPLVEIPLDEAQQTIQNIAAAIQTEGKFLYQDRFGVITKGQFFEGDADDTAASAEWVSVLGTTTLETGSLNLTGAIPDKIEVSWQRREELIDPDAEEEEEENENLEIQDTENEYYIQYPATVYVRGPNEGTCYSDGDGGYVPFGRDPVRIAVGSNLNPISGVGQTLDGVQVADGDRVLLIGQNNKRDNGIWIARAGFWERAGGGTINSGAWVEVLEGDVRGGRYYHLVSDGYPHVVGETEQEWDRLQGESPTPIECAGGAIVGQSPTDSQTPDSGSDAGGGCGNVPSGSNGAGSLVVTNTGGIYTPTSNACNENWVARSEAQIRMVRSRDLVETYYEGPAGQVSTVISKRYRARVEINSQFYADRFAYCASVYASECNPNGNCFSSEGSDSEYGGDGLRMTLAGETITTNTYAPESNELVEQVVEEYRTQFELAQPFDWRAGIQDGVPIAFNSDFDRENMDEMFLYGLTRTTYTKEKNRNVELVENFISNAGTGVGIRDLRDANDPNAIKTTSRRVSRTVGARADRPDTVNDITTPTIEMEGVIRLFGEDGRYTSPPEEAGPYVVEESIPMPLLYTTEEPNLDVAMAYLEYLKRWTKGDAFGIRIAEPLRYDIASNWRPGMPFRFADDSDKIMALRMDACTWGVTPEESIVVMNGIWVGTSRGTLAGIENVVGNSQPDMSGTRGRLYGNGTDGTPTGGQNTPGTINVTNETQVESGSLGWEVDVNLTAIAEPFVYGEVGVIPVLEEFYVSNAFETSTMYVEGAVYAAGSLLAADGSGSVPLEYEGSLVTDTGTVITADVFA